MNDESKKTFTPSSMIPFCSSRKINSYIVRAKQYPIESIVGSYKCGKKRCKVCDVTSETDTFSSTVTGEYTGRTTDSFRSGQNNYKSKTRNFDTNEECAVTWQTVNENIAADTF